MVFEAFCFLLTLQVGATILSVVLFILAALIFGVNIFDSESSSADSVVVMVIFVIFLITTGVMMFFSAFRESTKLSYITIGLLCGGALYWVIFTGLSFAKEPIACVNTRCAESFWLTQLKFGDESNESEPETFTTTEGAWKKKDLIDYYISIMKDKEHINDIVTKGRHFVKRQEPVSKQSTDVPSGSTNNNTDVSTSPTGNITDVSTSPLPTSSPTGGSGNDTDTTLNYNSTISSSTEVFSESTSFITRRPTTENPDVTGGDEESTTVGNHSDEDGGPRSDFQTAGMIIFTIANLIFFIFCILVMWSYIKELEWMKKHAPDFY